MNSVDSTESSAPDSPLSTSIFTLLNGDLLPKRQEVEIASSLQIPAFQIIGLPGPEVSEAKDRVRAAIESTGFDFPRRKLVLNLSPASIRKKGTGLDLAMAIAVLLEGLRIEGKSAVELPHRRIFAWGELGLAGNVKPVGSPARAIASAIEGGAECLFVAREEERLFVETRDRLFGDDAGGGSGKNPVPIFGIAHLSEAIRYLQGGEIPEGALPSNKSAFGKSPSEKETPTEDVRSKPPRQSHSSLLPLPRSLLNTIRIAASGAHHFLLLGPKGVGKSHALEWFLALQPALDEETLRMRSFLGEIAGKSAEEPFRRVGTQARPASLIGSYHQGLLRPGELSLAHGGVLLADEFPEWSRDARETLREPLERRRITLTRVDGAIDLPSDFVFAGNGNLCPCGGIPESPTEEADFACRCHPLDRMRYLSRLSGPILDRLDLVALIRRRQDSATVPGGASPRLTLVPASEEKRDRESVRAGVDRARALLLRRWGSLPGKMGGVELEAILGEDAALKTALDEIPFRSFRDRHKTLRIALTIAALQGAERPNSRTLLEARVLRTQADSLFRPA